MYTLNLHNVICQLHLNKTGEKILPISIGELSEENFGTYWNAFSFTNRILDQSGINNVGLFFSSDSWRDRWLQDWVQHLHKSRPLESLLFNSLNFPSFSQCGCHSTKHEHLFTSFQEERGEYFFTHFFPVFIKKKIFSDTFPWNWVDQMPTKHSQAKKLWLPNVNHDIFSRAWFLAQIWTKVGSYLRDPAKRNVFWVGIQVPASVLRAKTLVIFVRGRWICLFHFYIFVSTGRPIQEIILLLPSRVFINLLYNLMDMTSFLQSSSLSSRSILKLRFHNSTLIISNLWELVMDRETWRAAVHGVTKSRTWLSDWTELNWIHN